MAAFRGAGLIVQTKPSSYNGRDFGKFPARFPKHVGHTHPEAGIGAGFTTAWAIIPQDLGGIQIHATDFATGGSRFAAQKSSYRRAADQPVPRRSGRVPLP